MAINRKPVQPIFIVGYMHSGTTLLLRVMSRHSDTFAAGAETKFFEYLPMTRQQFPDLTNDAVLRDLIEHIAGVIAAKRLKSMGLDINENALVNIPKHDIDELVSIAGEKPGYGEIFDLVFSYLARRSHKNNWLEKTPTHIFHIDKIVRAIPRARFIEIVRDPRDVLASKKTRRQTVWTDRYAGKKQQQMHLSKAYDPFWDALSWKSAIRAGRTSKNLIPDRLFTITYEQLVVEPTQCLKEVCEFLSLEFEQNILKVSTRNAADWQSKTESHITQVSVGRWTQVLLPAEVGLIQLLLRQEMRTLDYVPQPIELAGLLWIPAILCRSGIEFFVRLYRRWRLGGNRYLKNVLLNYAGRFLKLTRD